jgi:hypothetical protein
MKPHLNEKPARLSTAFTAAQSLAGREAGSK